MDLVSFLDAHVRHPRLEHLVKVGFLNLASDLAYKRLSSDALDESQNRTHRLLGVAAEDVPFLRELGADAKVLLTFRECADTKDRQRLFLWQREHGVEHDVV